jgi:RNA polymerase sigma factor (TIGR02999 family)
VGRESESGVTQLLLAWRQGDEAALDRLMRLVYDDLRRVARRHLRNERQGHTLQATALVNEVYMRLVDVRHVQWVDRAHFFAVAARLMRRVLVDAARARRADKRGGDVVRVSLEDHMMVAGDAGPDLVALDDALRSLASVDSRKSQVVELRFFGGLTVDETAEVLGVSAGTVANDWTMAKLWLLRAMTEGAGPR